MTSSPAPDLDELERLAKAATPPDWHYAVTNEGAWIEDAEGAVLADAAGPDNAAYIAALVNAAPALITELRAAREAAAEALRKEVEALPFRFNNARDASLLASPAPDLEPRTEAGRRLEKSMEKRPVGWLHDAILAIEAEAAAESGRLREAYELAQAARQLEYERALEAEASFPVVRRKALEDALTAVRRLNGDGYFEPSDPALSAAQEAIRVLLATPPAPSDHPEELP